MPNPKILLVDDNENLLKTLSSRLSKSGFTVAASSRAAETVALAVKERPDLIVLDLHLGDTDGFEILKKIREDSKTEEIPVLFLTGEDKDTFKVYGLGIGADDYMTKPFSSVELIARIHAILRRSNPAFGDQNRKTLKVEDLRLDVLEHELHVGNEKKELSLKETELLHCLWKAKGKILSREYLLEKVWGYQPGQKITTRTVDVHVRALRKKLDREAWRLITVKNQGYRFEKRGQIPSSESGPAAEK